MSCVLGIDISTTASKALLVADTGDVLANASRPHSNSSPRPLWSEQDPGEWWQAVAGAIRDVLDGTGLCPNAVGLTGQMHGLVLLGSREQVLRPAMLWNDGRSFAQCHLIRDRVGAARLVALTGNNAYAGFTAPKLLWVRSEEPSIFANIAHVLLPKDFIRYRLTEAFGTDMAGAGGTLLLDLKRRTWARDVLQGLDIPLEWLPQTHEGPEITGRVCARAAVETGLREGTPVVAGGGDQAAQAVGVGAIDPETWAVTLGTSGVVFAPCREPRYDAAGRAHAFPHAVPDRWHMMGVMLSAAGSLRWYHDTLAADMDYDALLDEAADVAPGSDGLIFLPYLTGERTPHDDPHALGAFVGLAPRHTRGHMTRSVLEGVAFGLRDNFRLLQAAGLPPPKEVRISGGGARNALWRQIIADIVGVPLASVEVSEGAALGAAALAGVGAGLWPTVQQACKTVVRTGAVTLPVGAACDAAYERFRELYRRLRPFFAQEATGTSTSGDT